MTATSYELNNEGRKKKRELATCLINIYSERMHFDGWGKCRVLQEGDSGVFDSFASRLS